MKVAGACSILVVFSLSGLAFFSILHVAMQLQRRHICVSFERAVFLKVVFAAIAGTEKNVILTNRFLLIEIIILNIFQNSHVILCLNLSLQH